MSQTTVTLLRYEEMVFCPLPTTPQGLLQKGNAGSTQIWLLFITPTSLLPFLAEFGYQNALQACQHALQRRGTGDADSRRPSCWRYSW